jgi:hypothetical protein
MALLRLAGTPTPDFILPVAVNWTEEIVRAHSWRVTGLADHLRLSGVPAAHVWRGVGIETPDLLSQDRLRPLVSALKSSSAELYRLAKLGAELLNCEPDTPVSCLAGHHLEQWGALQYCHCNGRSLALVQFDRGL